MAVLLLAGCEDRGECVESHLHNFGKGRLAKVCDKWEPLAPTPAASWIGTPS